MNVWFIKCSLPVYSLCICDPVRNLRICLHLFLFFLSFLHSFLNPSPLCHFCFLLCLVCYNVLFMGYLVQYSVLPEFLTSRINLNILLPLIPSILSARRSWKSRKYQTNTLQSISELHPKSNFLQFFPNYLPARNSCPHLVNP